MTINSTFYPYANPTSTGYWGWSFYGSAHHLTVADGDYNAYIKFDLTGINKPCTISSAHVNLYADVSQTGTPIALNCYFVDNGDALIPTSGAEANALPLTSATAWDFSNSWNAGSWYESIDITSSLQSVIDRDDFTNYVIFVLKDNGTNHYYKRQFIGYESGNSGNAQLHVSWHCSVFPPLFDINLVGNTPSLKHSTHVPVASAAFKTHIPSRNVYNMDTAGIAYYPHNPVIGSGTIDIRDRFKTNYIGERISLKFQNDGDIALVLNDYAAVVSTMYRKHGVKVNIIGDQVSLQFQNDEDTSFGLEYLKIFVDELYRKSGTRLNVKGTHLGFKFQNTSDLPFQLQYLKIFGEKYENQ